jgi:hypothetical protein
MTRLILALIALAVALAPRLSQAGQHLPGGWILYEEYGFCFAAKMGQPGLAVGVALYPSSKGGPAAFGLLIGDPLWQAPDGRSYPVIVAIDGTFSTTATLDRIADSLSGIYLPPSIMLTPFTTGSVLTVTAAHGAFALDLAGSAQAVAADLDCIARNPQP